MKRLVLGSGEHFASVLRGQPKLLGIPGLASLAGAVVPPSGCKCTANTKFQEWKARMEQTMQSINDLVWQDIKKVLGVDEICYYVKVNGKLELRNK